MNELLLVAGMALVTVAIRYPTMAIFGRIPLPDALIRALRYVPVAIALLATICCTALFILWKNIRIKTIWDFKTKILNPILTLVQLFFREVPARTQEIGRTPASPHNCDRPVPTQEWPCSPPCFTTPSACG